MKNGQSSIRRKVKMLKDVELQSQNRLSPRSIKEKQNIRSIQNIVGKVHVHASMYICKGVISLRTL